MNTTSHTSNAAMSSPVTTPVTVPFSMTQVHLRCISDDHARRFYDYLMRHGVVVDEVNGPVVVIAYGGHLRFVEDVTTAAVLNNFATADAMVDLLAEEQARIAETVPGMTDVPLTVG